MESDCLTFRQKKAALEKLFMQYQRAKFKLFCLENNSYYPTVNYQGVKENSAVYKANSVADRLNRGIEEKQELQNLISLFDMIIESLNEDSKRIIINDFLKKDEKDWWISYYAKSTYYRLKTRAMEELLFYLNI